MKNEKGCGKRSSYIGPLRPTPAQAGVLLRSWLESRLRDGFPLNIGQSYFPMNVGRLKVGAGGRVELSYIGHRTPSLAQAIFASGLDGISPTRRLSYECRMVVEKTGARRGLRRELVPENPRKKGNWYLQGFFTP